jgi:protein MpaA
MSIIEKLQWAKSAKGQNIALYQSTITLRNPIIIIGGVHGDEPEGVSLAKSCLAWLKRNTDSGKKTTHDWVVIPCLNVDGFAENTRVNGNGVDLNRNYPSADWSAHFEKDRYFPGNKPASEPEIQALLPLFESTKPKVVIHCHSWLPCIVINGNDAQTYGRPLAQACGYELKNDIGYPTPGSLSRFGIEKNIPVVCIEEAEKTPDEKIWPHFQQGFEKIFYSVQNGKN